MDLGLPVAYLNDSVSGQTDFLHFSFSSRHPRKLAYIIYHGLGSTLFRFDIYLLRLLVI